MLFFQVDPAYGMLFFQVDPAYGMLFFQGTVKRDSSIEPTHLAQRLKGSVSRDFRPPFFFMI